MLTYLKAILFGVLEGVTEWLPISSTGHLIILNDLITLDVTPEFWKLFEVVIQLGAVLAAVVLFWNRLWPFFPSRSREERRATWLLWAKIAVAILPSVVIGGLLDGWFDAHFYNAPTVAAALIVYGVAFIVTERLQRGIRPRVLAVEELSFADALRVGLFQVLAIIPGTSRSGATILGGMLTGLARPVAAEFSFYLAIPTMAGASLLKTAGYLATGAVPGRTELLILLVASAAAFLVSLAVIRFLMDFVKKHTFTVFGHYRIILGLIVLGWYFLHT